MCVWERKRERGGGAGGSLSIWGHLALGGALSEPVQHCNLGMFPILL